MDQIYFIKRKFLFLTVGLTQSLGWSPFKGDWKEFTYERAAFTFESFGINKKKNAWIMIKS